MIFAWVIPALLALGLAGTLYSARRAPRAERVIRLTGAYSLVALGGLLGPHTAVVALICLAFFLAAELTDPKGHRDPY